MIGGSVTALVIAVATLPRTVTMSQWRNSTATLKTLLEESNFYVLPTVAWLKGDNLNINDQIYRLKPHKVVVNMTKTWMVAERR